MLRLRGSREEEEGGPEEPRLEMLRYSRSAVMLLASRVFQTNAIWNGFTRGSDMTPGVWVWTTC
jgi:hypothetical protein